jgi:hypothetical protein
MTIYILGTPEETAQAVDDKSLDNMIKDIAQVLCCAQRPIIKEVIHDDMHSVWLKIPIEIPKKIFKESWAWWKWARECVANYEYLVKLGLVLCREYVERFTTWSNIHDLDCDTKDPRTFHKMQKVIEWAQDNVPSVNRASCVGKKRCTPDCGFEYCIWDIEPLQFPLVMPSKYYKYREVILIKPKEGEQITVTNEMIKEAIKNTDLKELLKIDHVQSYRNYYQAKLIKTKIPPTWTRRQPPAWINL